jgi:hypothetical protein
MANISQRPLASNFNLQVYPLEKNPEDVWSVERQMHTHMD